MPKADKTFEVYLVHVDADRCDGCEACAIYCPGGVFHVSHKALAVYPEHCLGCRTCVAVCKPKAVIVTEL